MSHRHDQGNRLFPVSPCCNGCWQDTKRDKEIEETQKESDAVKSSASEICSITGRSHENPVKFNRLTCPKYPADVSSNHEEQAIIVTEAFALDEKHADVALSTAGESGTAGESPEIHQISRKSSVTTRRRDAIQTRHDANSDHQRSRRQLEPHETERGFHSQY
ncbi:uncharacterized protein BCR38DRAFT_436838 [Pseudomassariella vexata]|uniref:Uncharacterized protein n=1 Tax=Pseudomassariella vexata TaxID=1141098 RepID=A0A1Y2DVZ7_9PEZI|nr:uncharacterized protein BCR38DRAFT_436838 [Pseudomassariella vexata]ORY63438.1 hypothetical protein BCR38DRAFT_436838 [Pseudomassariella vexata]